jgi:hypothetical protein
MGKMKTVKVTLEYELAIPDDWKVLGEEGPDSGTLLVNGERYEPALTWMKVTEITETGHAAEQVDAETGDMFAARIVQCTQTVEGVAT